MTSRADTCAEQSVAPLAASHAAVPAAWARRLAGLWAIMVLGIFAPVSAWSETVLVTSGEHDGYTRLVLTHDAGIDWSLRRQSAGYVVGFRPAPKAFDLRDAFRRITTERISGLQTNDDGLLQINLACDCHAIAFRHDRQSLVVDVRDGPAPPGSAFEGTAPAEAVAPQPAGPPSTDTGAYDWTDLLARRPPLAGTAFVQGPRTPSVADAAGDTLLRTRLLAVLSDGASSDVIGLDLPQGRAVLAGVDGVRIAGAVPSIRMGPGGGLAPVASPDSPCPPDADIDVASWSDGRPFADQLADLRRASFGEVDKPEPTVTAALVRLYLHLGFGAEAAMLLADDPDPAGDHGWLQAIAGIVEGKPGPYPALEGWRGCTGDAALWAALATPLDQVGGPFPSGVRRGFARLPPHLRQILADPLAARAAAANDGALASSVMLATRRLQPLKQGEKVADLLAALRAGGADTVETALALVHAAATARSALPPEIPDGLRVLADEQTDPVRADDLRKAALVASLVNGDVRPVLADPDLSRRTSALWALMHATTEDVDFISVASTVLPDADAIAALDRTATAARALDLGFPEIAQRWLAGSPEGDPAARLLQARVAIALGDFRGAQELVDGSPAAEAVEIAALAAEGLQQHAEAAALWVTLDQPERSARAARLAGEPGSDSPAWAATATSANGAVRPPTAAGVGPLAAGAALVSESQALRAAIAEMVSPAD